MQPAIRKYEEEKEGSKICLVIRNCSPRESNMMMVDLYFCSKMFNFKEIQIVQRPLIWHYHLLFICVSFSYAHDANVQCSS